MTGKLLGILLLACIAYGVTNWKGTSSCSTCLDYSLPSLMPQPSQTHLPYPPPPSPEAWKTLSAPDRLANTRERVLPLLHTELTAKEATLGNAVYLRAFKETRELELWVRSGPDSGGDWTLFRTYPVVALSGDLGPKLAEGDRQTPEGFYSVHTAALNPASSYHLSFNIGYPNAFDQHHRRTGSHLMIHGRDVSVGCLAMGDPAVEEIYTLVEAALTAGQPEVPVHIFPFRMTEANLQAAADSEWLDFWKNLKEGHDHFEQHRLPPDTTVSDKRYVFK